jgi:hypothetical protein
MSMNPRANARLGSGGGQFLDLPDGAFARNVGRSESLEVMDLPEGGVQMWVSRVKFLKL